MEPSSPLCEAALQGLASVEDFSQVELRKSSNVRKYTDPFVDLMLILVKGRRHVQVRLVEPTTASLRSGDCYVLVTPRIIYCWLGKSGNVIEKAKAKEFANMVYKRKGMGFQGASPVVIIEEGTSAHENDFLCLLGGSNISSTTDTDDEDFEARIVETTNVYVLDGDQLVIDNKWTAQHLKFELLHNTESVVVMDFGTELYVWFGPKCSFEDKETGLKLAKEVWDEGVDYSSSPNSFRPFGEDSTGFKGERPYWCIFGKINQNIETQLFKDKFCDWPESRRRSSYGIEFENGERKEMDSSCCDVLRMLEPDEQPVTLLLEGTHVGRGRHWVDVMDEFISREFDVVTNQVTCWHVGDHGHRLLADESYGQFHDSDTYVVRWEYVVTPTSVKSLRGGVGRLSLTGRDRCAYFFWHGKKSSVNEKGASALMTVELDAERGPHVGVTQGQEPPCFTQLFGGRMIVHNGKRETENSATWKLFILRNEIDWETSLLEVPCLYASLRERSSLLLVNTLTGASTVFHGSKSPQKSRDCMNQVVKNLRESTPTEMGLRKAMKVEAISPKFYSAFQDYAGKTSSEDASPDVSVDISPRLFQLVTASGLFNAKQVLNPCRSDHISPLPFTQEQLYDRAVQPALFLYDIGSKVYLWQGWWADGFDQCQNVQTGGAEVRFQKVRKLALETTQKYCSKKGCSGELVVAGYENRDFIELFPCWEHLPEAEVNNTEELNRLKGTFDVVKLLSRYSRSYSYNDLMQKPEGVDTAKMESYLCESEFEDVFSMNKESFYQLPSWKQIALRKSTGLF